jgi:hypothetical protein
MSETIDIPTGSSNHESDHEAATAQMDTEAAYGRAAGLPQGGVASPLAQRLRAQHERILARTTQEFPVPGWDDQLYVRVKVIEDRETFADTLRSRDSDAAFIARAVVGVSLRDEEGKLKELIDDAGPLRLDHRFADMLGLEARSASDLVNTVLNNPARVTRFAERLLSWMQGETDDAVAALRPT